MNLFTPALSVFASTLVLVLLSWKWCLPASRVAPIVVIGGGIAFLSAWWAQELGLLWPLVAMLCGAIHVTAYVGIILWLFYRDPERHASEDPSVVVSPADGNVIYVRRLQAGEPLRSDKNDAAMILDELGDSSLSREELWQVGISMVFTDVHVNRAPIGGAVLLARHRPGKFLSLRLKEALNLNERQTLVISTEQMDLALVQIASRLVRRIVCYVKEGEVVERSERIGMIKFGSQVDVFLPTRVCPRLEVEIGQRLTAGETPISRIVSPGVGIEVP